jgi:hypothetical protein
MKKTQISIVTFVSLIVLLSAFSPALAVTQHVSMGPRAIMGTTLDTSSNWAGYAVTGDAGSVTTVSGSWTVPSVTGSKGGNAMSAFWVGIDGFTSQTVEQIGTDSDIQNGKAVYYAWYEFYPKQPMMRINTADLAIKPGDSISASVTYSSSIGFTLTIYDSNANDGYSITMTEQQLGYTPERSSAEWIAEAPSNFKGVVPLANFNTITFTNCRATVNGALLSIDSLSSSAHQIDMIGATVRGRTVTYYYKAVTSGLTSGTDFTVSWKHA